MGVPNQRPHGQGTGSPPSSSIECLQHRPTRTLLRQPLHPIRRVASMCRSSGLVGPTRHGHGATHLGTGCGDAEPVHPRPPARRHHTPHPAHAPAAPSRPPLTPTFSDMGASATQVTAQVRWTPNTEIGTSTEVVPAGPTPPQQPVPEIWPKSATTSVDAQLEGRSCGCPEYRRIPGIRNPLRQTRLHSRQI